MNNKIKVIAFDADDTLWVNEPFYRDAQTALEEILEKYVSRKVLHESLYATEMRNLAVFGYGAKSFTLSMIETAIEISQGRIIGSEIHQIIELGKELVRRPVKLLPGVKSTVESLSRNYELMIITKGDLFDQESKIARSQLAEYFKYIEIVSNKNEAVYQEILERHNIPAPNFMMIGNSLPSDVLPVVKIGGIGVHIPYHTTWQHETVDKKQVQHDYQELNSIDEILEYFESL